MNNKGTLGVDEKLFEISKIGTRQILCSYRMLTNKYKRKYWEKRIGKSVRTNGIENKLQIVPDWQCCLPAKNLHFQFSFCRSSHASMIHLVVEEEAYGISTHTVKIVCKVALYLQYRTKPGRLNKDFLVCERPVRLQCDEFSRNFVFLCQLFVTLSPNYFLFVYHFRFRF